MWQHSPVTYDLRFWQRHCVQVVCWDDFLYLHPPKANSEEKEMLTPVGIVLGKVRSAR